MFDEGFVKLDSIECDVTVMMWKVESERSIV